ncbi:MAG: tetratricopeptide repeat protein [Bacteroidia bacterium]|nr:tetratricopeptide repeat protein [Bacteroidia bacterium]
MNIYGQGGVGKTYLSRQYKGIAEQETCLAAYSDEDIKSVLKWMERVSAQFGEQDAELKTFNERYTRYLQETQRLEADPEKPKGTFGNLVRGITKGAIKEGKKMLPGGELIGSFIDEEGLAATLGDWADFIRKKVANKDEVELVLEPEKVLTPLFWQGVAKYADSRRYVCFFIDTFEEADAILETWLLEVLNGKHGEIPGNILLIIAGREPLDANRWADFQSLTEKIPLEPFTADEAQDYLGAQGITDPGVQADIQAISGRLPVLMAFLASAARQGSLDSASASETAVERFLKWVSDPARREIALAAALPRRLNQDVLEVLLADQDQAGPCFEWLCAQPFVQRRGDHWAYHPVVRDQMLRYMRLRSPRTWSQHHQQLADYHDSQQAGLGLGEGMFFDHETWMRHEQERWYHLLCCQPDSSLKLCIERFSEYFYKKDFSIEHTYSDALMQAGTDTETQSLARWGADIQHAIASPPDKEENYPAWHQLMVRLLDCGWITKQEVQANLWWTRGLLIHNKHADQAIECYQQVLAIKPDIHEVYYNMGIAWSGKGDFDRAIECYQQALAIKPDDHETYYHMSNAWHGKGDFNRAIECYQQAITLKPDYHEAYYYMGYAWRKKGDFDRAIECYQQVLAIKPDMHEAYYSIGVAWSDKGNFDRAIKCYQQALAIKPDIHEAYYSMGNAWYHKRDFDRAIECYRQALAVKPDNHEAYNNMGNAWRNKGDFDRAIECYQQALAIKPDKHEAYYNMGVAWSDKGNFDRAIECFQQVLAIKPDTHEAYYSMGNAWYDKRDLDRAIECYQQALVLKPDKHEAYYNMGNAWSDKGDFDRAIECYQQVLAIKPDKHEAYNVWGFTLVVCGRISAAGPVLQQCIAAGGVELGNMNLGHVYLSEGKESEALACYQESLRHFTDTEEFWEGMRDDLQHLRQYGITDAYYETILAQIAAP